MFSAYLGAASSIAGAISQGDLQQQMQSMSSSIKAAIDSVGVVRDPVSSQNVYAFEIDGYGSANQME